MKLLKFISATISAALVALIFSAINANSAPDRVCNYQVGSTTVATGFANCTEEIADLAKKSFAVATVTGTNTILGTSSPAVTSLTDGQMVQFKAVNSISGTATFQLDGTAAATIYQIDGTTSVGSGDIEAGFRYILSYQASPARWIMLNSPVAATGGGDLIAANNLSDLDDAGIARANLGLGTAATKNTGTSVGNVVEVQSGGKLPALDASNLTNLPGGTGDYQVFTSSGTWNKPSGLSPYAIVKVQVWGAGGGGKNTVQGGGGGGGSYVERWFQLSELGASETVTVGTGGAGGVGAADGSAGGNSSFGSLVTAYGGAGGNGTFNGGGGGGVTGAGSAATGGNPSFSSSNLGGGSGSVASGSVLKHSVYGGGGGGLGNSGATSLGGDSIYGGGGGGGNTNVLAAGGTSVFGGAGGSSPVSGAGNNGTAPGGGGGASNAAGAGNGALGEVRVTVFAG